MDLVTRFQERFSRLPTEHDPDYLEMLNMSKYRMLVRPDIGPNAKCANCGSAREDERLYIDFGLQIDWYGPVYLCTLCIKDIAINAKIFRYLEIQILKLETQIEELKLQRVSGIELRETILKTYEEVKSYFDSLSSAGDDSSSNRSSGVGVSKDTTKSTGSNGTESKSVSAESGATKPVAKPRSENVPSLANLLGT